MIYWRNLDDQQLDALIAQQQEQPFSYGEVGGTIAEPPDNYKIDHNRIHIGHGEAAFLAGCTALRCWQMFDLDWVRVYPRQPHLEVGTVVVVVARIGPLRWANCCRIAYVLDEQSPRRFGFAYGTLADHAASGGERFSIEKLDDGSVWYDILAFSRPQHWLAKVAYPLARRFQRRFARDSMQAIKRAMAHLV